MTETRVPEVVSSASVPAADAIGSEAAAPPAPPPVPEPALPYTQTATTWMQRPTSMRYPTLADLEAPFDLFTRGQYDLLIDVFFNAQHYVTIAGQRGPMHSHSFRLEVRCTGHALDSSQRIADFAEIRSTIEQVAATFSGQVLNNMPVFANIQPTSECLVTIIAHMLKTGLSRFPIRLTAVALWESPSVCILYRLNGQGPRRRGREEERGTEQ